MAIDQETLHKVQTEEPEVAPVDLSWMNGGSEWGISAKPGKRGLTLDEVNVGSYGKVPQESESQTRTVTVGGACAGSFTTSKWA